LYSTLNIIITESAFPRWDEGEVYKFFMLISGLLVRLKSPKCDYVWDYKGRKQYYATCPNCFRKINIVKYRVE
jgi:hypothetical protein